MEKYLLMAIMPLLLDACVHSGKERILKSNMPVEELKATIIPIKETFNPVDMIILDDYFVFQNEYVNEGNCFFVYSSDEMKFCYSFGHVGRGPNEFIAPRIVQQSYGNMLSIYDSAYDKIVEYDISEQKAEQTNEIKITTIDYPTQSISYVDDSTVLLLVQTDQDVELYSYNLQTNVMIDTLSFETNFRKKMGDKYNSTFDSFYFSNFGRKYVITFNFIYEVIVGTLDGEGRFPGINYKIPNTELTENTIDNVVYYLFPISTENYIYTQYYGKQFKYMQPFPLNIEGRSFDFLIEVYDWEKNPVRLLHLDNDILRFHINEKTNKLYAWNPLQDFDYLLEYDLSQ
jgi:hypothetical protein